MRSLIGLVLAFLSISASAADEADRTVVAEIAIHGGIAGFRLSYAIERSGRGMPTSFGHLRSDFPHRPVEIDAADIARLQALIDQTDFKAITIPAAVPIADGISTGLSVRKTDGSAFSFDCEQGAEVPAALSAIDAEVRACYRKGLEAGKAREAAKKP
jgi:hypothetical protein